MFSKLRTENKGFSLVELIVSFAILGIASVAIVGLMSSGMRFFKGSSEAISLQYEYQTVMTQLREYIVDCNGGIVWDDAADTLYIVYADNSGAAIAYTTHVFVFDAPTSSMGYVRTDPESGKLPGINYAQTQTVSERMTSFDIDVNDIKVVPDSILEDGRVVSIAPQMGFHSGDRQYSAKQGIALRNRVAVADVYDPADINSELMKELRRLYP